MRILLCDMSAGGVNANFRIDQEPLKLKVSATTGPIGGTSNVQDTFESKVVLGRDDNKTIFITTQTGTAVNGQKATVSATKFRDSNLLSVLKNDYIKKYGEQKWNEACAKVGGEEELYKLIRGFSANIAANKSDYAAWHNNNPTVTGTKDTNNDRSFSPQELEFNAPAGKTPQYCVPLDNQGNIITGELEKAVQPKNADGVKASALDKAAFTPPIAQLLSRPGYRFDYAKLNADGTSVSYNLHFNGIVDGRALMGSTEATVTFSVDASGTLTASVVDYKGGQTYTYTDTQELRSLIGKFSRDGMISATSGNTFQDNGIDFYSAVASYDPKTGFDYTHTPSLQQQFGGKEIPVMAALLNALKE